MTRFRTQQKFDLQLLSGNLYNRVFTTIKAILDNSEIPAVLPVMSRPQNTTKTYTLKPLKLFLVDDKEALKEILESFMTNTIESLNELEHCD
jgi:hypothetical protein